MLPTILKGKEKGPKSANTKATGLLQENHKHKSSALRKILLRERKREREKEIKREEERKKGRKKGRNEERRKEEKKTRKGKKSTDKNTIL